MSCAAWHRVASSSIPPPLFPTFRNQPEIVLYKKELWSYLMGAKAPIKERTWLRKG